MHPPERLFVHLTNFLTLSHSHHPLLTPPPPSHPHSFLTSLPYHSLLTPSSHPHSFLTSLPYHSLLTPLIPSSLPSSPPHSVIIPLITPSSHPHSFLTPSLPYHPLITPSSPPHSFLTPSLPYHPLPTLSSHPHPFLIPRHSLLCSLPTDSLICS